VLVFQLYTADEYFGVCQKRHPSLAPDISFQGFGALKFSLARLNSEADDLSSIFTLTTSRILTVFACFHFFLCSAISVLP
jgi:hypothetical protein